MRQIGRMGESIFSSWCASVGLTANGSEVDETGWDFFLEFPSEQKDGIPIDMLPASIECKIQVKSTDKKRKRESIKLSNLDRLVKAKMPTFFCFIEFDGKDEVQAAYLVHVDREIIEKVLKRLRELDSKGENDSLNKHKMTIHYTNKDRLTDTTGTSLRRAIEKYVPDTLEKYIESKNELLKTLGFEDGKGQFTISVSSTDPMKDMVDLTLGLREEIYIDRIIGYHKRFGILSNNPLLNSEEGILTITANPIQARVSASQTLLTGGLR